MADITEQHDQTSPNEIDDGHAVGNGAAAGESRGVKRQRPSVAEDEDDDDEKGGRERRKIEIKFITDKSRRHITFSKRKAGIMKKVCRPNHPPRNYSDHVWACASCLDRAPHHPIATASAWPDPRYAVSEEMLTCSIRTGLRAVCPHGHTGPPSGRFGNRTRLHLHDA